MSRKENGEAKIARGEGKGKVSISVFLMYN